MEKQLSDGRIADVQPLIFGRARINVGNGETYDDNW